MQELLLLLGGMTGIILIIVYGSFSWGFVLYKSWYWFILPVFPALPHITFLQAVGLNLFTIFFKSIDTNVKKVGKIEIKSEPNWAGSIIAPWIGLVFIWLVHLFI